MKILVTGANGFLGSNLIKALSSHDEFEIKGSYHKATDSLSGMDSSMLELCDLTNLIDIENVLAKGKFDAIVHTAALITKPQQEDATATKTLMDVNLTGSTILAKLALENKCSKFINCSSMSVYDMGIWREKGALETEKVIPPSAYGLSKLLFEQVLETYAKEWVKASFVNFRLSGIYGQGRKAGAAYFMIKSALAGNSLQVFEPQSYFRFLHVDNTIQAIILALRSDKPGLHTYNLADEEIFTLTELAKSILQITGSQSKIEEEDKGNKRYPVLDIEKVKKELGFQPESLQVSIEKLVRHMK